MQKVLVSACLLGQKVRYDGGDCLQQGLLDRWQAEGRVVPFCPEVAGGLPIPRPAAEIMGGDAEAVLSGRAGIATQQGVDVTDAFLAGAEKALAECRKHHIRIAVMKEGSPSCGVTRINDGTFSRTRVAGMGLTARQLQRHGITLFSEAQLDAAAAYLAQLEEN